MVADLSVCEALPEQEGAGQILHFAAQFLRLNLLLFTIGARF